MEVKMPDTPFVQQKLSNGLTVVIEIMPHVHSVACGFLVRTGARDDTAELAGVSHFLEHMCFKGTQTRTWEQINIEFDEMGANYNAYTSKNRTFYYGWVRSEDFDRQLALLADMMRSALPPQEFDMEKNVILEEIAMSNDDLSSKAYDLLHEVACPNTPIAWPVLGYEAGIQAMTHDQMQAYFQRRYAPNNLILIVAGNVDPDHVLLTTEKLCGGWEPSDLGPARVTPTLDTGLCASPIDRFHQQAVLLAFPSASAVHPLDETAEAMAAILGGSNSRFYWNIIQQGLATRAGVFREEYEDFGLLVMYGLCEPDHCEKLLEAMRREASKLVQDGVEPKEIQRVRNLRRTSLASESETPYYRLGQIADDVDYRGAPRSPAQRLASVEAVNQETIAAYLEEFPVTGEGFLCSTGPRDWPTISQ